MEIKEIIITISEIKQSLFKINQKSDKINL